LARKKGTTAAKNLAFLQTGDRRYVIGASKASLTRFEQGCRIRSADATLRPLPESARDEITRLFE